MPLAPHNADFNHELLLAASASALPMTTRIHLESRVLPNIINLPWLRLQGYVSHGLRMAAWIVSVLVLTKNSLPGRVVHLKMAKHSCQHQ